MGTTRLSADDKWEIHELLSRAAWGYDEAQLDVIGACFTADAVMTVRVTGSDRDGRFEGRDAVLDLFRSSIESQNDRRRHVLSNVFFEPGDAGGPLVVSTLTLMAVADGAVRVLTTGTYRDAVAREDDAWRIRQRDLVLDLPY